MMSLAALPLLLMMLVGGYAAPNGDYPMTEKRAALVLDRLLIALKNALRETPIRNEIQEQVVEEPQAVPLRYEPLMAINDMTGLQRRGQASTNKGRVLRCYFNAITCF